MLVYFLFIILGFACGAFLVWKLKSDVLKEFEAKKNAEIDKLKATLTDLEEALQETRDTLTATEEELARFESKLTRALTKLKFYAVKKRARGKQPWRFVLKALNHKVIATSETYHNRKDRDDTIDLFREIEVKDED